MKRRIVLFGPPASGKGTLADRLQQEFGFSIVSPGALLRAEKAAGSELGSKAHELTEQGQLVGDDIINALVGKWLEAQAGDGFVFDGYPRTVQQAEALEQMLIERGAPLEVAILLEAKGECLRQRVQNRATCSRCGNIVSIGWHVSRLEDPCPRCGGTLTRRADDTLETLERRLTEYEAKTAPLVSHYEKQNLLALVNAENSPEEVYHHVTKILS